MPFAAPICEGVGERRREGVKKEKRAPGEEGGVAVILRSPSAEKNPWDFPPWWEGWRYFGLRMAAGEFGVWRHKPLAKSLVFMIN